MNENTQNNQTAETRITEINDEFKRGFAFIKNYEKSASFFGSARTKEDSDNYKFAYKLAKRISEELKYTIVTGGGPGIMEAANKGAFDSGGNSLGMTIKLPREQAVNPYVQKSEEFYYFFVRKVMLSFSAEAYIFFPGGFGTMDEFFEILTLVQTHKIPQVPIILVGKEYWEPLENYLKQHLLDEHKAIGVNDLKLYTITDDEEEIMKIVREAPIRKE
ncbi:MAG: TIGR00730 family Rossman fold protein [Patescibacteria group bacterium]|nr:TIGR00730 family Rossman fold protein [Patescibacteria group bacterium]